MGGMDSNTLEFLEDESASNDVIVENDSNSGSAENAFLGIGQYVEHLFATKQDDDHHKKWIFNVDEMTLTVLGIALIVINGLICVLWHCLNVTLKNENEEYEQDEKDFIDQSL